MKAISKSVLLVLSFTFLVLSYNACSQIVGFNVMDSQDMALSSASSSFEKGQILYQNNCSSCHQGIDSSAKRDRTASQITSAINGGVSMMAFLKGKLTAQDINDIALALSSDSGVCDTSTLAKTTVRRMNFREFFNSARDLLGKHSLTINDYPADGFGSMGFDNEDQAIRTIGTAGETIFTAAEKVVDSVMANASSQFNSCNSVAATSKQTCVTNLLLKTARLAYRKKVTTADIQGLVTLAMSATDTQTGVRNALVGMIVSPRFLFHVVDYGVNRAGQVHTLSAYEFASRLSFMLWSSIPDETLLSLADSGQILDPAVQKQQITRMLKDPKGQAFVQSFPGQWLGYNSVPTVQRSATKFPEFTPALRSSIVKEADMMVADVINRNLSVDTLITADYAFIDQNLATFYGLPYSGGATFSQVPLDGTNRRGLLTQAAFMTATVDGDSTSPVHRGVVMLTKIVCEQVDPPPKGVPQLQAVEGELTLRQIFSQHTSDSTCMSCHRHFDPLGFGFENFSSIGKWRDNDSRGRPYDVAGVTADGYSFRRPGELASWIVEHDKFKNCMSKYLSAYAVGRTLGAKEKCYANKIVGEKKSPQGDLTLQSLIEGVVGSDLFRKSLVKE